MATWNATLEMNPGIAGRPVFTATIRKGPEVLWTAMFRSEITAHAETKRKLTELGAAS